eukprot:5339461-Pyramimonas_sp.AAC.1
MVIGRVPLWPLPGACPRGLPCQVRGGAPVGSLAKCEAGSMDLGGLLLPLPEACPASCQVMGRPCPYTAGHVVIGWRFAVVVVWSVVVQNVRRCVCRQILLPAWSLWGCA